MSEEWLAARLRSFWTRGDLRHAWRLSFEDRAASVSLLLRILGQLPTDIGRVEFSDAFEESTQTVILLARDANNEGARINTIRLLLPLADGGAIDMIGVEGASGPFDFAPYRAFPNQIFTWQLAQAFLDQFRMGPAEFVGITCERQPFFWGIEDKELYLSAYEKLNSGSADYWDVIAQRAPRMMENALEKLREMKLATVALPLTDYNYQFGRRWLRDRRISYAGVRAMSFGATHPRKGEGYRKPKTLLDRVLLGEPLPPQGD